jgi:hypothetical protein
VTKTDGKTNLCFILFYSHVLPQFRSLVKFWNATPLIHVRIDVRPFLTVRQNLRRIIIVVIVMIRVAILIASFGLIHPATTNLTNAKCKEN